MRVQSCNMGPQSDGSDWGLMLSSFRWRHSAPKTLEVQSRCSHVSSLLLYMNRYVGGRLAACTELPCEWKKGSGEHPAASINSVRNTPGKEICSDPRPTGSCVSKQQTVIYVTLNTSTSASQDAHDACI